MASLLEESRRMHKSRIILLFAVLVEEQAKQLSVLLGDTFDVVLLLDGEGVGRFLGAVHDLISQALRNGLDGAEGSEASTGGDQIDSLVDTTDRRHIDGLTTDGSGGSDLTGVFTWSTVLHGVDEDLDWVLLWVNQVDDLQGLLDDAHGLHLLTVVAAVHHKGASHTFDDWAESLAEAPGLVATGGVRSVRLLGADVINQGHVLALEALEGPLSVELRLLSELHLF